MIFIHNKIFVDTLKLFFDSRLSKFSLRALINATIWLAPNASAALLAGSKL